LMWMYLCIGVYIYILDAQIFITFCTYV
jgi:hypothetical protein